MKIGFIGAGHIGSSLARLAVKAGHEVTVSNSRNPRTLFSVVGALRPNGSAGSAAEAAAFGDVVIVAIPFYAVQELPKEALHGKIVLDTSNYFAARDEAVPELDAQKGTESEIVASILPSSIVVKGFNAILATDLFKDAKEAGQPGRRAIPIAGDVAEAKSLVASLIDSFGYDTVDVGPLKEGYRFAPGTPAFGAPLDVEEMKNAVASVPERI